MKTAENSAKNNKEKKIMIVTSLEKIFEIARSADVLSLEAGRYELDGADCFYMIQKYDTKSPDKARHETHENYIDIQIILSGEEEIRFETLDKLTE